MHASGVHGERQLAAADGVCGLIAGAIEAAAVETPMQAISIKMLHDQSPAGPHKYRGLSFVQVARAIHAEHGLRRGFYCGVQPTVLKGAAVNCIRFPAFNAIKRALQADTPPGEHAPLPLPPAQAIVAGGSAGALSVLLTHPIDTVMGNMQGLESGRYRNAFDCARALVRAGGVQSLYFGMSTRIVRVVAEVGLSFSLYEQLSPALDRWLG